MAGTKEGGKSAARTNKQRYGADFYEKIGAKGGKKGRTGGFASTANKCHCFYRVLGHKKAECAGSKGGKISRRNLI